MPNRNRNITLPAAKVFHLGMHQAAWRTVQIRSGQRHEAVHWLSAHAGSAAAASLATNAMWSHSYIHREKHQVQTSAAGDLGAAAASEVGQDAGMRSTTAPSPARTARRRLKVSACA